MNTIFINQSTSYCKVLWIVGATAEVVTQKIRNMDSLIEFDSYTKDSVGFIGAVLYIDSPNYDQVLKHLRGGWLHENHYISETCRKHFE